MAAGFGLLVIGGVILVTTGVIRLLAGPAGLLYRALVGLASTCALVGVGLLWWEAR